MNSSAQIFLKLGNYNYSTNFRSSHRRCSIKKAILKHFVIFTEKHLCRGLFFNKVAAHLACTLIKKRLQHRYYLANIWKFIGRTILKNIIERLHCWKVFCEKVFHIRSELCKRTCWLHGLLCERMLKLVKIE